MSFRQTSSYVPHIKKLAELAESLKPPWKVTLFGSDNFAVQSLSAVYDEMRKGWVIPIVLIR